MNTKKTIYLIRHAQGTHNVDNQWTITNPRLTQLGKNQCIEGRSNFQKINFNSHNGVILVSPLVRTIETATLLFPNQPLIANENIRECIWNPCDLRQDISEIREEFSHVDFSQIINNEDPLKDTKMPEKLPTILERCRNFDEYIKNCSYEHIVVVTHWAFISNYMKYFQDKNKVELQNCEFIKFEK